MVAEVLRSGAYCDEVVMNLANRRFVPFYYDVAPPEKNYGDGWAYDPAAVKSLGGLDELRGDRRGGNGRQDNDGRVHADGYPALLFFTPDGERIDEGLWGVPSPEEFVAAMKAVMAGHPQWSGMTDAEKATLDRADARPDAASAQLEAARLCWELADFEDCLARVETGLESADGGPERAELLYLKGRAMQCLHRPAEARDALSAARQAAADPDLADGAIVAMARCHLQKEEYEQALELLSPLTETERDGRWIGAAMYFAGLCHHRLGDEAAAKGLWRRHREQMPYDRLARRSAASLGLPEAEAFLNQQLLQKRGWW